MSKRHINFLEKYLNNTTVQGECVIWTGGKSDRGYGTCKYAGRTYRIHVLVYAITHNTCPYELREFHIHHKCGNKICVNSNHLEKLGRIEHRRKHLKNICVRGHNISVCGRNKHGQCNACYRGANHRKG